MNHHQRMRLLLLLLLSFLPLVFTRGFAISSWSIANHRHNCHDSRQRRIPQFKFTPEAYNTNTPPVTIELIQQLRGGGLRGRSFPRNQRHNRSGTRLSLTNDSSSSSSTSSKKNNKRQKAKIVVGGLVTALVVAAGYEYREPLAAFFDKDAIQHRVLSLLHSVHGDWRGVVAYSAGMAVWELFGMATIPVETAAGMVFGFRTAFCASAMGKLIGAVMGFVLGRTVLQGVIGPRLEQNKVIHLIHDHVNQNPIKVALLLRYSLLPEVVKNCGASLFAPIRTWMFVLSIMLHGWMFTACWTYLGVDTARRLETPGLPINRMAQFGVLWATVVGMVLTPIIMAWWIRDMQQSELNIAPSTNGHEQDKKKTES